MSKHSQGPWTFKEGSREKRDMSLIVKQSDKDFLIGYALCDFRNELARVEDVANARLMAAAPELLDGCREALLMLEMASEGESKERKIVAKLRKLIARVEGGAA